MKIKSAIVFKSEEMTPYSETKPIKILDVDLDKPGKGEVLIKIEAAGLCHSDLSVINGKRKRVMPIALGHEAAGVVVGLGKDVEEIGMGDHVVCTFVPTCGKCEYCIQGRPSLCKLGNKAGQEGTLISGRKKIQYNETEISHHSGISAFSTYAVVSVNSIVKIPKDIPFEIAVVCGCAVVTGVGSVLNTAKVHTGSKVGIIGLGGVGLSALLGAKVAGTREIVAIDIHDEKLEIAEDFGVDISINSIKNGELLETQYKGYLDYVIETAGSSRAFDLGYQLLKPGGTIVTTSLPPEEAKINIPHTSLTFEEKTIKGSYIGSSVIKRDIPMYLDLYKKGLLPIEKLVSNIISLEEINEGFDLLRTGTAKRIIIKM